MTLGDSAIEIEVILDHDTLSCVCGNADCTTYCGSTGSGVTVDFYNSDGNFLSQPADPFVWSSPMLTVTPGSTLALVGNYSFTM